MKTIEPFKRIKVKLYKGNHREEVGLIKTRKIKRKQIYHLQDRVIEEMSPSKGISIYTSNKIRILQIFNKASNLFLRNLMIKTR